MKKFISVILAMLMICSTCVCGGASAELTEEQIINNQLQANEQYQRLLESLGSQTGSTGRSVSEDYYGGAYINDHGNLVVCVTDAYPTGSSAIQTYTANDDVIIRQVDYTFAELKHEQDRINALYQAYSDALKNADSADTEEDDPVAMIVSALSGTYIDEEKNILVVQIVALDEEKKQAFRSSFSNKDYIAFEQGCFVTMTSTTESNPGMAVYNPYGYHGSMGYPVYYTAPWGLRELGFITAGHLFEEGDSVYRDAAHTQVLGVCEKSQCYGSVDAALIRITNSSYTPSFQTESTTVLSGHFVLAQGSYHFVEGCATGKSYGEILSTSYSASIDGVAHSDLYGTDIVIQDGDSGGVAYDTAGKVIGSVLGMFTFYGDYVCGLICKYENTAEAFDCSVYG